MTTLTLVFNAVMAINQQTLSDQTSIGMNYFMLKNIQIRLQYQKT